MKKKYEIRNTKYEKQRGFTVLESIVAIFILSLSISGAFSAVSQSLSQSIMAKDQIKAFYLAQEAVEMVRNIRDSNQLAFLNGDASKTWLSGITKDSADPCYFGKVCAVDVANESFIYCGDSWKTCPNLNQDEATYLYKYGSGNATNIKREIKIESLNGNLVDPEEIAVIVTIYWNVGEVQKEFRVKTLLLNRI